MIIDKLYRKQWQIGICRTTFESVLSSGRLPESKTWLELPSLDYFQADPFLLSADNSGISILYEEYVFNQYYGKISLLLLNNDLTIKDSRILIDSKTHLSYPFIHSENGKIYIIPDSAHGFKLSAYEFKPAETRADLCCNLIGLPLIDGTILEYDGLLWLFCVMPGKHINSKLYIFWATSLFGPWSPHRDNPVKSGPDGCRPAGSFIRLDGSIFRPSQNCGSKYGESITINRVVTLNKTCFREEPCIVLKPCKTDTDENKIHAIHTLNTLGDLIVIDGLRWTFSPLNQARNMAGNWSDYYYIWKIGRTAQKQIAG